MTRNPVCELLCGSSHTGRLICWINRYDIDDGKCWYRNISTIFNALTYRIHRDYVSRLVYIFISDTIRAFLTRKYRYHVPAPSAGLAPVADATLVNGLGRFGDGPNATLAVVSVQPNKRYRIRLVSISCDPNYTFSIDNHTMVTRCYNLKWRIDQYSDRLSLKSMAYPRIR